MRARPPIFRAAPAPSRRAFSLLELTLVLMVMGVLAALAVPRYANALARYRADAAARRVVADLDLARTTARSSGTSYTVVFNAASKSYQVLNIADPDHPNATYTVSLSEDPYNAKLSSASFGGGVSTSAQVTFDGFGSPDNDGTITLQSGVFQRIITLTAATGKATVQ